MLLRSLPLPGEGNIGEDGEEVRPRKERRGRGGPLSRRTRSRGRTPEQGCRSLSREELL